MTDITAVDGEFALVKNSGPEDKEFDTIVGYIEDIIVGDKFSKLQKDFMNKHYKEFEDTEENKFIYTDIFKKYTALVEKYLEDQLKERVPNFVMDKFVKKLEARQDEVNGDIFDILLSFTDFNEFKSLMLSYRAEKEGTGPDLSGLVIQSSLSKGK